MGSVIVEGWLLGLSTGPYCLGACMPFMVPYLLSEGQAAWKGNVKIIGEFLVGRLLAYVLFGALVGWFGALVKPYLNQQMARLALGLSAALMLLYALSNHLPRWRVCEPLVSRLPMARMPLLLGLLIGINVCPPFLVAVARLLQMGKLASSVVFFVGFFLGTSLYTVPLLGLSPFTHQARAQRIGRLSALLVGGYFLLAAFLGS